MIWATKRKFTYLSFIFGAIFVVLFLFLYPRFSTAPSCTDFKKNGDERGIDCGGSCELVCSFDTDRLSLLWSRVFEVTPGRYSAVAYVENHNSTAALKKIKYKFTLADKDNLFVARREGETFIPPGGKFAIFEPNIITANSVPVFTDFEFTEEPVWYNVSKDKLQQLRVVVSDINFEGQNTSPKLSALIKNNSFLNIKKINIVVILYDKDGNALSASQTYFDDLKVGEEKVARFTWPSPILGNVVLREVIPMYDVFSVELP